MVIDPNFFMHVLKASIFVGNFILQGNE